MEVNSKQPLLSICIPTYNRSDVLQQCLHSIVTNKAYNEELVEIVISDNVSTDSTQELCMAFAKAHRNVIYHRNDRNIGGDLNFIKVLSLGTGTFLKLNNDYSIFTEEGLKKLLQCIRKYKDEKSLLYFDNFYKGFRTTRINSLDEMVYQKGIYMSWIGAYGFWHDDFNKLEDKSRAVKTQFMQVDWFLRLFVKKNYCILCQSEYTVRYPFKAKQGGYNFFQVQVVNFSGMFLPYVNRGITPKTYHQMLRKLLNVILQWVVTLVFKKNKDYSYKTDHFISTLFNFYKGYWWFYEDTIIFFVLYPLRMSYHKMKRLLLVYHHLLVRK